MSAPHRPMRIAFVSIEDASDVSSWSGLPSQVLRYLRKHPVEILLISPLSRRLKWLQTPSLLKAKLRHQRIVLNHSPTLLRSYARQIERRLAEAPADIVFSMNSLAVTYLRCPQPVIFWNDAVFHDMVGYYPGFFSQLTPAAIELGKREEERALHRADVAIYSSTWAADTARTLDDPAKVQVIPFGSSLSDDVSEEEIGRRARDKRAQRPSACRLLFVGVDWERKGGDVAVATAQRLIEAGIDTTLSIVGCLPPRPLPGFVEVLGTISKSTPEGVARLSKLFRDADLFILPTKAEAAGIVFCEASSFGLPTLTYQTGGTPEYIRDGVNGVLLTLGADAAAFAASARTLLKPARYEEISVDAFRQYRDRLNWDAAIQRLLDIFNSVVSQHQPSGG